MATLRVGIEGRGEEDAVWYTPEAGGNRDDEAPWRALLLPLSAGELQKLEAMPLAPRAGKVRDGTAEAVRRIGALKLRVLRERVLRVADLETVDVKTGAKKKPATGAELVDLLLTGDTVGAATLEELFDAITDFGRLEEGRRPLSASPSASP